MARHELAGDPRELDARHLRLERGQAAHALRDPAELAKLGLAQDRAEELLEVGGAGVDRLPVEPPEEVR